MNILPGENERSFCFTLRNVRKLRETVKDLGGRTSDGEIIYHSIREEIRIIPFGDYLKRYIYLNSGMNYSFREIPLNEYRDTIAASFRENGIATSLRGRELRLITSAGRWLEQEKVSRETMLLLGFGLNMLADEVDTFFTEALHDHRMDPEDPLEGLCRYCFTHHYGWDKLQQLRSFYDHGVEGLEERIRNAQPAGRAASVRVIRQDLELLTGLLRRTGETSMQVRTRECFMELYESARQQVRLDATTRIAHEIGPADLERALCPAVPRDSYGNKIMKLQPEVRTELGSKRFTQLRQHLLLSGKKAPTRYDLLTLGFLLHAGSAWKLLPEEERIRSFRKDMNRILAECGFGPVYEGDPYESVLLLALSCPEPLEAYSGMIEMACNRQESGK